MGKGSKRKAEDATADAAASDKLKKPKKIPKMVKAKIYDLLEDIDHPVDITEIKALLADKYEFPDSEENKNKVWKALKDMVSGETFGRCGVLCHGGPNSPSFKALTPEDLQRAADLKAMPKEKYTCQDCQATDEYCEVEEPIYDTVNNTQEYTFKCLNSCYRVFKVIVDGKKRTYKHGYQYDETTEVMVE